MSAKEVKVYSTPRAPGVGGSSNSMRITACKYTDFNVAEDPAAREEMINKCKHLAVPTIYIDGEVILSFNEAQLKEKLGL